MIDRATMKLNIEPLLIDALREDINCGDISAKSVLPVPKNGIASLICKSNGILCGIEVFARVFTLLDDSIEFTFNFRDGDEIKSGDLIAYVKGDMRTILSAERTALNYLQRMSGIASRTHEITQILKGSKTELLDTRKTTPNNRIFEKYAVKTGGGNNHRYNLSGGIMLKDNHIGAAGGITQAIAMARDYAPFVHKIEVETETLEMVEEAVNAGADIIMLDNMDFETMDKAMKIIGTGAKTEISGNVDKTTLPDLLKLEPDYVSMGAITYSAPVLDFSLKNLHPTGE